MGIISVVTLAAFLLVLFVARRHLRTITTDSDEDTDLVYILTWVTRVLMFVIVINTIWVVDTFFYKLPNPFDGPKAENLERRAPDVEKPESLKLKADPSTPDVSEIRKEHNGKLDAFEGSRSGGPVIQLLDTGDGVLTPVEE